MIPPFTSLFSNYITDPARDKKRATLYFAQDNPYATKESGLDWLKSNPTRITAGYRNAYVPVAELLKIPGENGEHKRFNTPESKEKLDNIYAWLKHKGHAALDLAQPLIVVDARGKATVREGNHRILAASQLGYKAMPIWVNYLGGSEMLPANQIFDPVNFI
jgi:hypothetical protein